MAFNNFGKKSAIVLVVLVSTVVNVRAEVLPGVGRFTFSANGGTLVAGDPTSVSGFSNTARFDGIRLYSWFKEYQGTNYTLMYMDFLGLVNGFAHVRVFGATTTIEGYVRPSSSGGGLFLAGVQEQAIYEATPTYLTMPGGSVNGLLVNVYLRAPKRTCSYPMI